MHTIWENSYDEIEAIAAGLREEYPDMEDDELISIYMKEKKNDLCQVG